MNIEDCAQLEEKYAQLAVQQANKLQDAHKKVDASIEVMQTLREPRIDLQYRESRLYKIARRTLLGIATGLVCMTSYIGFELQQAQEAHRQILQQQIIAVETLSAHRQHTARKSYQQLELQYAGLKDENSRIHKEEEKIAAHCLETEQTSKKLYTDALELGKQLEQSKESFGESEHRLYEVNEKHAKELSEMRQQHEKFRAELWYHDLEVRIQAMRGHDCKREVAP